jgi:excisionase family DNA binding protein
MGKRRNFDNDEFLTPDEVADLLKISKTTLWRLEKKGVISAISFSRKIKRYRRKELEKILEEMFRCQRQESEKQK